jgi:hypothetical protein
MRIENTLFKISWKESMKLSIFLIIGYNGVIFFVSMLTGKARLFFYESAWILQIVLTFVLAIKKVLDLIASRLKYDKTIG